MQSRTGCAYPEEKNPERRDGVRFFLPDFLLACRPPPGWEFRKKGKNVVGVRGGKAVNPSFAAQETGSFHTNY